MYTVDLGRSDVRRITSPHIALEDCALADGYMVANTLIGALIAGYVAQEPGLASLHAGAVRIGDGLVLLLGDNLSGKSTLATALAMRGQRYFADDRLVLDLSTPHPMGRSLAMAPKLRLPLPPEADAGYRAFVHEHRYKSWSKLAVLSLGPSLAAGFGEALPIRAMIQLCRDDKIRHATLSPLRQPAMVRLLLAQLFAPHLGQQGELSACVKLAQGVSILRLDYPSAFAAADIIIVHFSQAAEA